MEALNKQYMPEREYPERYHRCVYISPVRDDDTYDVRVRSINKIGKKEAWQSNQVTVVGKTAIPNAPSNLVATSVFEGIEGSRMIAGPSRDSTSTR